MLSRERKAVKFGFLEGAPEGVYIRLRVQPRASRDSVEGEHGGALRIRLTSPPVEGEANRALVKYLSKLLGLPKSSIRVVSGPRSRSKRVLVEGASASELEKVFEIALGGGSG